MVGLGETEDELLEWVPQHAQHNIDVLKSASTCGRPRAREVGATTAEDSSAQEKGPCMGFGHVRLVAGFVPRTPQMSKSSS